jgi:hypothetical protein
MADVISTNPEALRATMQVHDLGNVPAVAGASVNNVQIHLGNNLHALVFHALSAVPAPLTRAQLIADVVGIQAFLDNELIYDRTATECLDDYLRDFSHLGAMAAPLGVLWVPFVDWHVPVYEQKRGFSIGMLKRGSTMQNPRWHTLTYVLTMTAAPATAAQIQVRAICDTRDPEETGIHMRRLRQTRNIAAVGLNHVNDLPTNYYGINAYHVVTAAGNIRSVSVQKDSRFVMLNADVDVLDTLSDQACRTPVAGYSSIYFNQSRDLHGCERLRNAVVNWDVQLTCAIAPGAGTVILSEEVHDSTVE